MAKLLENRLDSFLVNRWLIADMKVGSVDFEMKTVFVQFLFVVAFLNGEFEIVLIWSYLSKFVVVDHIT